MPNKSYRKGYMFEREFVNTARKCGHISFRSAGSHSPIDVIVIDPQSKTISLIQAKAKSMCQKEERDLEKKYKHLNGNYKIIFSVRTKEINRKGKKKEGGIN